MTRTIRLVALLLLVAATRTAAQTTSVSAWRAAHERQIVDELLQLVSIPNVAGNDADMRRNADAPRVLFEKRGFTVETHRGHRARRSCSRRSTCPSARGTLALYIHYDGQPVDAAEWTSCKPFAPCVYGAGGEVTLDARCSPIRSRVARLRPIGVRRQGTDRGGAERGGGAARHGQRAGRGTSAWCSTARKKPARPTSAASRRRSGDALKADLAITLDGPRHPSGRPTLYYGVRGGAGRHAHRLRRAQRPALRQLRQLGARSVDAPRAACWRSMKDETGRVDDRRLLRRRDAAHADRAKRARRDAERRGGAEEGLRRGAARAARAAARAQAERADAERAARWNPAAASSAAPRSAIPASAAARIEMRLVHGLDPAQDERAASSRTCKEQGYFVVEGRDPTDEERLTHPLLARVDLRGGSAAPRVSMDEPMAQCRRRRADARRAIARCGCRRSAAACRSRRSASRMPTVGVLDGQPRQQPARPRREPAAANLWEGIEMLAAIMTMSR